MTKETQPVMESDKETQKEESISLETSFIKLSEKFKTEKEAYDKEIFEIEDKIQRLEKEILELEEEEKKEINLESENSSEQPLENINIEETVDNAIESLSIEEKEILNTEMKNSEPLDFETKEAKTKIETFLGNEIVKSLSGIKVSEKIKGIIKKSSKYILSVAVVSTLWSGVNEKNPLNLKDSNNKDKDHTTIIKNSDVKEKNNSTISPFIKTENNEYVALPENVREIHSYAIENIEDSYIIVDKPSATLYVFNEENELVETMPVLLGKTKGEEPNTANANDKKALGSTTPAGKYKLGKVAENYSKKDSIEYQGRLLQVLGDGPISIHMTYPKEFKERTKALNSKTVNDNRMSWGCMNISPENFDKYIKPYFNKGNQTIFITPDDTSLTLNPENGKIEKINQVKHVYNLNKEIRI